MDSISLPSAISSNVWARNSLWVTVIVKDLPFSKSKVAGAALLSVVPPTETIEPSGSAAMTIFWVFVGRAASGAEGVTSRLGAASMVFAVVAVFVARCSLSSFLSLSLLKNQNHPTPAMMSMIAATAIQAIPPPP